MSKLTEEQLDLICERQLFSLPYFRAMLRSCEQRFYEELDLIEPVLDIGAGDGHFAEALLTPKQMFGLDPWLEPLLEANKRQVYGLLTRANGDLIPAPGNTFPTAISNSVLEHIPEVQPVLNDVCRCLRPGGRFLFAVPNNRFRTDLWGMKVLGCFGLNGAKKPYSDFFNKIARHYNLDAPDVWLNRLSLAGFKSVDHWNYFPVWAMQKLERGHLGGIMTLASKKLFGKWILHPSRSNPFIPFRTVRRLIENPLSDDGTCTFFVAYK